MTIRTETIERALDGLLRAIFAEEERQRASAAPLRKFAVMTIRDLAAVLAIGKSDIDLPRSTASEACGAAPRNSAEPKPTTTSMMTEGEIARTQGFTGDCCTGCGGFSMRRNGTWLLCVESGTTTGCS